MGIELELIVLLLLQLIGTSFFAVFELETPAWKKVLKWLILSGITLSLTLWIGHFALLFPGIILVMGIIVHISFCKKNSIDPLTARPRKKYYKLRGWKWEE